MRPKLRMKINALNFVDFFSLFFHYALIKYSDGSNASMRHAPGSLDVKDAPESFGKFALHAAAKIAAISAFVYGAWQLEMKIHEWEGRRTGFVPAVSVPDPEAIQPFVEDQERDVRAIGD